MSLFGFKSHAGALAACLNDYDLGLQYQKAVLKNRKTKLRWESKYITDRSFVDNATYIMLQLAHALSYENNDALLIECSNGMVGVDGLIFLRWNADIILEDNGHRIMNRLYHEMVDNVMAWVVRSKIMPHECKMLELYTWDFETRITHVGEWIKSL